ncbi:SHOCT domain-containing protein [Streptomyces sp. A7024]|uniref:SHOCT domain-containing protein n=1 Tax=Streptomyces coryli TaxID=1128680 RepID=A0A6G4TRZ9_9ACTN|nr:SHOCT domain-containing protein [Streptomyces coryli]NGN62624.1 SHOCT domain-containing protein [Streptomyces coryli]
MDYPLLNVFLTMLWFFLWVLWLVLVFKTIVDIFRSYDLSGWAKTGWLVCVIVLPFVGVFAYLVVRSHAMNEREMRAAQARDDRFGHGGPAGAGNGETRQLSQLAELRQTGALTDQEYLQAKTKVLSM